MFRDLQDLLRLTRGHRLAFGLATLALSVSVALGHLVPLVSAGVIDAIATVRGGAVGTAASAGRLASFAAPVLDRPWLAALVLVALTGAAGAFAWLRDRTAARAAERAVRDLRDRLHDHLQHLPCATLDRADTGDFVQRCTSDVETVRLFLTTQVLEIGRTVVMVLLALPVMIWIDGRMTLVSLAVFPVIFAFGAVFFRRVKQRFLEADEAEGAMTATLQENLTGIRVVQAFSRQDHENARFSARAGRYRDLHVRVIELMGNYWSLSDLLCGVQVGLTLFVGAHLASRGQLSIGSLFAFMAWAGLLIWPVRQLGRTLTESGKAVVALRRITEILDMPEEADPAESPAIPGAWPGRIEFRGVRFAHGSGHAVLDGLDLVIEPGQSLALVGPPGCGKSTLIALLLRLHDPQEGEILLDGVNIADLPRKLVRSLVATVLQEPFLYSRTIDHNIRVGRPRATRHEVEDVARAACLHETVMAFPDGYDTLVGERGVTLSGGQRQRVALARTLLEEAPVLVLDDVLSAVDTRTEGRIREALAARRGRRTSIVIAHRLTTTRQADVVAVLRGGRVAQLGTHDELAAVEGAYRRLWDIQSELETDIAHALERADQGGVA